MIPLMRKQTLIQETISNNEPTNQWIKYRGAQQKCFDRGDALKHEFFVVKQEAYEQGFTNTYNSFKNIESFLIFQKSWEGVHNFQELIREDTPCMEYYDIDGLWSDGWKDIHDCVLEFLILRNNYAECKENTINNTRIIWSDLVITEACNDKKLSLHIIIRPRTGFKYFNNTKDQRTWANKFSEWIKKNYSSKISIDTSVYNKNSLMRCVNSCKIGDDLRPFVPYGLTKHIKDDRELFCSYVRKCYIVVGEVSYDGISIFINDSEEKSDDEKKIYPVLTDKEAFTACEYMTKQLKIERANDYAQWFAIGSSLYDSLNGSQEGLHLFLEFSSRCQEKYDEEECTTVWNNMSTGVYKLGTLIHYYNQDKMKRRFLGKK